MTVIGVFILLSALPSGWLADRFGRKRLVTIAGLVAALGSADRPAFAQHDRHLYRRQPDRHRHRAVFHGQLGVGHRAGARRPRRDATWASPTWPARAQGAVGAYIGGPLPIT